MHLHTIVVDDERTFAGDVDLYLRTGDEALAWFANRWVSDELAPGGAIPTHVDELYLDHDLGPGSSVMPLVRFLLVMSTLESLVAVIPRIDHIYVHSMNPKAADDIVGWLRNHYEIKRIPLPKLLDDVSSQHPYHTIPNEECEICVLACGSKEAAKFARLNSHMLSKG